MSIESKNLINGTHGALWLEDDEVGEVKSFQAKLEFSKEEVNIVGKMATDTKLMGYSGKGSVTLFKVNSRLPKLLQDNLRDGKDVRFTIISKLADPDALGVERVEIKNVSFDDLTLANWETATVGEVEAPFTFTDYNFLDEI